jgi:hypothetical protein
MNGSANVDSLEALREWHAALCVFRAEVVESLASVNQEIQRSDAWLDDQMRHWQSLARDAEEDVLRCKNDLANRKFEDFSGRMPDCSVQEEALWKAEKRLDYIREQIVVVRRWMTKLPKLISEAWDGASRHLSNFLEAELPRGIALMNSQITALEQYLHIKPPESAPAAPPAAAKE